LHNRENLFLLLLVFITFVLCFSCSYTLTHSQYVKVGIDYIVVEKRLIEEVRKNDILIIVGETGSGKTTRRLHLILVMNVIIMIILSFII
jgi:ABC-type microcin C transport system duplicated ATPase subunit YejF